LLTLLFKGLEFQTYYKVLVRLMPKMGEYFDGDIPKWVAHFDPTPGVLELQIMHTSDVSDEGVSNLAFDQAQFQTLYVQILK